MLVLLIQEGENNIINYIIIGKHPAVKVGPWAAVWAPSGHKAVNMQPEQPEQQFTIILCFKMFFHHHETPQKSCSTSIHPKKHHPHQRSAPLGVGVNSPHDINKATCEHTR